MPFTIQVNGSTRTVDCRPKRPLLWVLRDLMDLKGSCGAGLIPELTHRYAALLRGHLEDKLIG